MPSKKIAITLDEVLARRMRARAADMGQTLPEVVVRELEAWLGDWGQRRATHIVAPGETLAAIAEAYYGDAAKATVIAAFNGLDNPNLIHVGEVLLLPEVGESEPLPPGESPYIFGIHDRGGEYLMGWKDRRGWVLCTEEIGADPGEWHSKHYADLANKGYGVLVRLNHGYGAKGTLPRSTQYADFAVRCGNFVERSDGCHIWIIGNEMNLAVERPGGPTHGEVITPERYARAFNLCADEIHRRPGHERDQVVMGAVGPWNVQTSYRPGNPSGDWIVYFGDVLEAIGDRVGGIAIHTYGRDGNVADITSELRMDAPFVHRRKMFRTYIDFMEAVPQSLRHLPVYLTETDQNVAWVDENNGWVRETYAEINRWNSNPLHQKIRCMCLYRWERHEGDIWSFQHKQQVIADFGAALRNEYRWYG